MSDNINPLWHDPLKEFKAKHSNKKCRSKCLCHIDFNRVVLALDYTIEIIRGAGQDFQYNGESLLSWAGNINEQIESLLNED